MRRTPALLARRLPVRPAPFAWSAVATLLVLATLAALLVGAPPVAAATTPQQIATELRRAPLVVDPALADAVPAAQRRAVLRAIRAAPHPVWVVLVPLTPGDRYGGRADRFLSVVHGRFGRDGVYVAFGDRVLTTRAFGVDEQDPDLYQASTVANFESDDYDEPQIAKVRRFVEALSAPDLDARAKRTEARLEALRERSGVAPPPPAARSDDDADDGAGGGWLLPAGAGLLALVAALALLGARRQRRRGARPARGAEPLIPARVFEHAHTAQAGELREQIDERLLVFAERVDRMKQPEREVARERKQHALDAYAAVRRVLRSEPAPIVDLVGALVLVQDGTGALADAEALEAGRSAPDRAPLCFFDPRHPGTAQIVGWERGLRVPACKACRADLRAGRPPAALLDAGRPWFEADSLWARTGFGVFEPDLAQRVLRGELRRRT